MNKRNLKSPNFVTISRNDLPSGRKGKHHAMLLKVLQDLDHLSDGNAIRIPLEDYRASVADIRSAVHRATAKLNITVATSSDEGYFYVWKPKPGDM